MKYRGFVGIIFLIGCATGGAASQLVIPPVRAGTAPTRWEYLCSVADRDELTAELNKLGAQGWELATMTPSHHTGNDFRACAKRAMP